MLPVEILEPLLNEEAKRKFVPQEQTKIQSVDFLKIHCKYVYVSL